VPGVTSRLLRSDPGSSPVSAASTARSAQPSPGLGFSRRGTAASWRSTSNAASFDAAEPASSAIQPVRHTKIRQSIGTVTSRRYCQPWDDCRRPTRRPATYTPFRNPTGPFSGLRQVQGGVLGEDRQLKVLELRARLDRQLLGKQCTPGAVGCQRLGLAAGAVQREHQLPAQPFAQWVLGHQPLKLGAQRAVPAKRQLRLDPVLHRGQPARFEPLDLEPGERFELEVGQRPAAPQ
jgi:hypothetical protein